MPQSVRSVVGAKKVSEQNKKTQSDASGTLKKKSDKSAKSGLDTEHLSIVEGLNIKALCSRAKIISQIISYIWLNVGPETSSDSSEDSELTLAEQAAKWFKDPTFGRSREPKQLSHFEKLMTANPNDPAANNSDHKDYNYVKLLKDVFKDHKTMPKAFPLFNRESVAKGIVLFITDPGIYEGHIQDPDLYSFGSVKVVIAFPPRPQLGKSTVTKKELKEWINETDYKKLDKFLPPSPYIPTCCT